jgi:predicted Rossmann fold nucleotide-binding protein DprA/Smf involved in DNA uptake
MTSREAYIVLNQIGNIGPVRVRALCEALGSPEAVLSASGAALSAVRGVGPKVAEGIVAQRDGLDAGREEKAAAKLGARLITPVDPEYPPPLKAIYDPPLCLYVRGALEAKDDRHWPWWGRVGHRTTARRRRNGCRFWPPRPGLPSSAGWRGALTRRRTGQP